MRWRAPISQRCCRIEDSRLVASADDRAYGHGRVAARPAWFGVIRDMTR